MGLAALAAKRCCYERIRKRIKHEPLTRYPLSFPYPHLFVAPADPLSSGAIFTRLFLMPVSAKRMLSCKRRAWDPAETQHLNDPLLILHGTHDGAVPFAQGQALASALGQKGLPVSFKALKHKGHGIGELVYSRMQVWDWLLSQKNTPS